MPIDAIRRIAATIPVAALLSVPAIAAAPPAAANAYPPGPGALFLSSNRPIAGLPLTFIGRGFRAREPVAARLDARQLSITRADIRGTARGTVVIPRNTKSGPHTFSLRGTRSGRVLSATVVVRHLFGRSADAASTDINTAPVASQVTPRENGPSRTTLAAGSAAALAAFGGSSYLLHRRRRSHSSLNR